MSSDSPASPTNEEPMADAAGCNGDVPDEPSEADQAASDRLKGEANQFFKDQKYNESIEIYSKAIELTPKSAVLFANR